MPERRADGEDPPPELRLHEREPSDQEHDRPDDDRVGDAEKRLLPHAAQRLGNVVDRHAVVGEISQALHNIHHAQRGDERRHKGQVNGGAADKPEQAGQQDAQHGREPDRPPVVDHKDSGDHAGEGDHGADRQIDAADDQDMSQPHRENPGARALPDNRHDIVGCDKRRAPDAEIYDQQGEAQQHRIVPQEPFERRGYRLFFHIKHLLHFPDSRRPASGPPPGKTPPAQGSPSAFPRRAPGSGRTCRGSPPCRKKS